jgi:hypothetical protein
MKLKFFKTTSQHFGGTRRGVQMKIWPWGTRRCYDIATEQMRYMNLGVFFVVERIPMIQFGFSVQFGLTYLE